MGARRLRIAVATVNLVGGAGTAPWLDPDKLGGAGVRIQLEYAPVFVWWMVTNLNGGAPGFLSLAAPATASEVSIQSSNAGDVSTVRVYAVCRAEDFGI